MPRKLELSPKSGLETDRGIRGVGDRLDSLAADATTAPLQSARPVTGANRGTDEQEAKIRCATRDDAEENSKSDSEDDYKYELQLHTNKRRNQ